jgi:hypothetical protein
MSRMMIYSWYDQDNSLGETKMGDHFVPFECTLAQAETHTIDYIRTQFPRRARHFNSGRVLYKVWDVSDIAKKFNKFRKGSHIDDLIREACLGHLGTQGREFHALSFDDTNTRIDRYLHKMGTPPPVVGLTAWQARSAERVLAEIAAGKRTIMAELCARFGKTIWGGVLTRETNAGVTVVVSYVLTSFASFEKEFVSFKQFADFVTVDTSEADYQQVIDRALAENKQVVAFLSMCVGTKRQQKIDYLFGLNTNRLVLIDEADFGVHRAGQARPLVEARNDNDVIVLMTGTNADKAVSFWPVDSTISVVYPELLIEKRLTAKTRYSTSLKHFSVDSKRHDLVVDVEFYQMDLKSAVEFARVNDPDAFDEDGVYLPSWTKFAANPIRAKGFWTRMLQAVFLGQHGWDELNVEEQFGEVADHRVAMMFLSGSMRNTNLDVAAKLAQQALPGYAVIPVYGGTEDDAGMTNRSAEKAVKEAIELARERNQSVLLLSAGMAQRSFSVGAITELYLAYDEGDNGATIQKISRALTPEDPGKVGRVVSLSFDPNRDDKFDALLIETALNYKRNRNIKSAKEAMRDVLRTVDIFRCTPDGAVKLDGDDYLEQAIERKSLSRVVGKVADITRLSVGELTALAQGNAHAFRAAKQAAAERGRTRASGAIGGKNKNSSPEMATAKLIAQAREVITTIVENLDIIVQGTGTNNINHAFKIVDKNSEHQKAIAEEFGVEFDLIKELFEHGVINADLVELQVDH